MRVLFFSIILTSTIFAVGEAGAIFLLISPGAGAQGTGEAQVAKVDDAYASFYNPAGLAYLQGTHLSGMHVRWLPQLAKDINYEYLGYSRNLGSIGSLGGHFVYLDLGEQQGMDEFGNPTEKFKSYMWASTTSYGTQLNSKSSLGVSFKVFHQKLANSAVGYEEGKPSSTDFAFDVGYLNRITDKLKLGFCISNIGPPIDFIDKDQADPAPTNLRAGLSYDILNNKYNRLTFLSDFNKMLITRYPDMDWDGDGIVGGYDESAIFLGSGFEGADFNMNGSREKNSFGTFDEPFYKAIFTSWLDDWAFGGDLDKDGDGIIGGYNWDISMDANGNEKCDLNERVSTNDIEFSSADYGIYGSGDENGNCTVEKGSSSERKVITEFQEMIYNIGIEYWYANVFALRAGYIYDYEGNIRNLTFGTGVKFAGYGFDFGYTYGDEQQARANTLFFSINMAI